MSARDTLARLETALARAGTESLTANGEARDASVAVIFRIGGDDSLELLMIERARYEGDPWSGHVAFPGGRREPHDATLLDTAIRETREELGIDLSVSGRVLGALERLHPVSPSLPPLSVAPFVALLTSESALALSDEVAEAFWVPLALLVRPDAASEVDVVLANGSRRTVRAFVHGRYTIWGLTERIIRDLLSRLA